MCVPLSGEVVGGQLGAVVGVGGVGVVWLGIHGPCGGSAERWTRAARFGASVGVRREKAGREEFIGQRPRWEATM